MEQRNSTNIDDSIIQEIESLQPYINSHGGKIDFVEYKNSIVYVRLHGTCIQCPLSFYTLTYGIERQLKQKFAEISKVEVVE